VSATISRVLRLRDGSIAPQYADWTARRRRSLPSAREGSLNMN
jgi:hypothetical protein